MRVCNVDATVLSGERCVGPMNGVCKAPHCFQSYSKQRRGTMLSFGVLNYNLDTYIYDVVRTAFKSEYLRTRVRNLMVSEERVRALLLFLHLLLSHDALLTPEYNKTEWVRYFSLLCKKQLLTNATPKPLLKAKNVYYVLSNTEVGVSTA